MVLTWAFALMLSLALRIWGIEHPDSFVIRPLLVFGLLFGPSLLLAVWLVSFGFASSDS